MNKGWLELESDPGLFTLLLEDFGVGGIQVEEIYDLQKAVEGPVYGFIFLFKWIEERRARRKTTQEEETFVTDENIVNSMFFAQQIIPNSCATHALLSVLLNCENVALGDTLTQFKEFTQHMGTEDKGFAIGNMPDLARAHNRHARPEPYQLPEKQQGMAAVRTAEAFHFVSYVPVNGRLFELDGLKPHPIDHGPWGEQEDWTEKFRRVITERLGMATDGGEPYHDIRFNLMAVVPDRRQHYEQKLKTLKTNRQIILETLQQMVKVTSDTVESPRSRSSTGSSSGQSVLPPGAKGKAEPIITRSVAAKEAASDGVGGSGTKLRSTRLREKAAAAAQALSAAPGYDPRSPPELDSHNYAKSPDMQDYPQLGQQGVESGTVMDDLDDDEDAEELAHRQTSQETIDKFERQSVRHADVKIQITVEEPGGEGAAGAGGGGGTVTHATTVASTDITKPLIIQTKFGNLPPGPGTGSSTDTASEVGSCLSSPVCSTGTGTCQPSPTVWTPNHRGGGSNSTHTSPATTSSTPGADTKPDISDPAIMAAATQNLHSKMEEEGGEGEGGCGGGEKSTSPPREKSSPSSSTSSGERRSSRRGFGSHAFTPKDLLQLLKNVESEISACESNLRDEVDKHNKYKMDQCRRTHNYDQFICTFLSMLAEQGHIASLVEPNLMGKRRASISSSSLKASSKKPDKRKKTAKTKKRK